MPQKRKPVSSAIFSSIKQRWFAVRSNLQDLKYYIYIVNSKSELKSGLGGEISLELYYLSLKCLCFPDNLNAGAIQVYIMGNTFFSVVMFAGSSYKLK
jgi:hypothetical protein